MNFLHSRVDSGTFLLLFAPFAVACFQNKNVYFWKRTSIIALSNLLIRRKYIVFLDILHATVLQLYCSVNHLQGYAGADIR